MKYKEILNNLFTILGIVFLVSIIVSLIIGEEIISIDSKGKWIVIVVSIMYVLIRIMIGLRRERRNA